MDYLHLNDRSASITLMTRFAEIDALESLLESLKSS